MVRVHPPEGSKRHGTQMGLHETGSELCRIASWDCFGTLSLLLLAIEGRCDVTLPWQQNFWITTIGSLSNDDGDGNENS